MLTVSSFPNDAYVLHLAEYLLRRHIPSKEEAIKLVGMTASSRESWAQRLRIANILLRVGSIDETKAVLDAVDVGWVVRKTVNSSVIKQSLCTLAGIGRVDSARELLKWATAEHRLTFSDGLDVRFEIANEMMRQELSGEAEEYLLKIDVQEAYSKNKHLMDLNARIGWILFWPRKDYDRAIDWIEKDLRFDEGCSPVAEGSPVICRLTSPWRLNYAHALAATGNVEAAAKQVEIAYNETPTLKDGYARIGWAAFGPQKDYMKVIKWIEKDSSIGETNSTFVKNAVFSPKLSPEWRLNYAQALAEKGDLTAAEKHVSIAYKEKPALKDGYARIAWAYFLKNKDYQSIVTWIRRDEHKNRLSPVWRIYQAKAIAKIEGIEAIRPIVEKVYRDSSELKNVFGQVAWSIYIPVDMAYEKVIPFFLLDKQFNRLNGEWQLNYAQALMVAGCHDEAEQQVKDAYHHNTKLTNGFARCAIARYFMLNFEPEKALEWFDRDRNLVRLSYSSKIEYAVLLASIGDIDAASYIIEKVYKDNPNANSGNARIGWYSYVVYEYNPRKALSFFEYDEKNNRLSPEQGTNYAGLYAYLGDRKRAEQMISKLYDKGENFIGGHILVGFCDYACNKDIEYLIRMIKKDEELNRISNIYLECVCAAAKFKTGELKRNSENVEKIAERCGKVVNYTESWLRRIGIDDKKDIEMFLSQEFKAIF